MTMSKIWSSAASNRADSGHSPKWFMNRGSKCHFCNFLLFVPTHHLQNVLFSQLQRVASVWNKIISTHKSSGTGLWDEKRSCHGHQPKKRSTHLWNVFVGYMCHGEAMATLAQECPKTMGKQKNRPISPVQFLLRPSPWAWVDFFCLIFRGFCHLVSTTMSVVHFLSFFWSLGAWVLGKNKYIYFDWHWHSFHPSTF